MRHPIDRRTYVSDVIDINWCIKASRLSQVSRLSEIRWRVNGNDSSMFIDNDHYYGIKDRRFYASNIPWCNELTLDQFEKIYSSIMDEGTTVKVPSTTSSAGLAFNHTTVDKWHVSGRLDQYIRPVNPCCEVTLNGDDMMDRSARKIVLYPSEQKNNEIVVVPRTKIISLH